MNPIPTRLARAVLLGATVLAATACTDREAQRQAQAAAAALAREQAATRLQGEYDAAVTAANWELARVHGAALLAQYPETEAATVVEPALADITARAEAAREQRRLGALWNYARVAAGKGEQRSAAIFSREPVDTGGAAPATVQLVIRDHPEWKRSAYLVLQAGDFRCPGGCKVKVVADGGAPKSMDAWRPDTDEAIAMFITDYKSLWKLVGKTQVVSIEFPVKDGGTRTAVFETGGLDAAQMPGWD